MEFSERIKGCIFGTAIGDTLGYQVEFDTTVKPSKPKVKSFPKGALYSDDTQMTRAVAEGILRAKSNSMVQTASEVAEECVAWAFGPDNNRAPGGACMTGCRNLKDGVPWDVAGKHHGGGCGAAMRSAPYGLYLADNEKEAARWAGEHALMTHRLSMAQASAAAVAAGVAAAGMEGDVDAILKAMFEGAARYDELTAGMLRNAIVYAENKRDPDDVLDEWRGWAGHEAVAASLFCFARHPHSFEEAVLLAVNSPGDSDSLGAITGAISGAFRGVQGIRKEWLENVEDSAGLSNLCARLINAEKEARIARHRYND